MALPKLSTPEFEAVIPSTGQSIRFRPFLVKEEKALYFALEGKDQKEMVHAVTNILKSCITTTGIDIAKLSFFDIEYLFMKLRGKSVGEIIDIKVRHNDYEKCDHYTDVQINLDSVKVTFPENQDKKIMLNDHVGVIMRYPTFSILDKISNAPGQELERVFDLLGECVEQVFDNDQVYDSFNKQELKEFMESLNKAQFEKIVGFVNNMPKLTHNITFACPKCGQQDTVKLEGLASFFL